MTEAEWRTSGSPSHPSDGSCGPQVACVSGMSTLSTSTELLNDAKECGVEWTYARSSLRVVTDPSGPDRPRC